MRIYSENDQQKVRKLKSKPQLEGMLFGFPPLIGFQQVVESPPRVLLIPKGVYLRFSDVWHFRQKRFLCFYMIQVVIYLSATSN